MKIQIDTKEKTIRLEEQVSLTEFIELTKRLFPNGEWKDYKLIPNETIISQRFPIIDMTPFNSPDTIIYDSTPYVNCEGKLPFEVIEVTC